MPHKKTVVNDLGADFEIPTEESAVDSHQSNGIVERAVQEVGGQVRTMKCAV